MAKLKVQGSRWWAFDGTSLIRLVCLKTFDPGSDSAGKSEVKERVQAAAKAVDKIAKKGGLSAETAAEIRKQILGIVDK